MFLTSPRIRLARFAGHRYRGRGAQRIVRSLYGPPYHSSHPSIQTQVTSRDGTEYCVDTGSLLEWFLFVFGGFEEQLQEIMLKKMPSGGTFVDCGANIGVHTCAIARRRPNGRVVAIEPVNFLQERLRTNVRVNRLTNVEVVPTAVGDQTGQVEIFVPHQDASNQAQASVRKRSYLDHSGVMVPIDTLDNIIASIGSPSVSVIKIDVEGQELEVLRGARRTLATDRPILYLEFDAEVVGDSELRWEPIEQTLNEAGYHVTGKVKGGMIIAEWKELAESNTEGTE